MSGSLLKNTLLYMPAQLLGPLLQFGVTIIWTHLLAPADFGVVTFVVASQEIVALIGIAWWSIFVVRFQKRYAEGDAQRFRTMDARMVAYGAALQILLAAPTLLLVGVAPRPGIFAASAAYLVTRTLISHYSEWARSDHRIGIYTIAQLAGPAAGAAFSIASILLIASDPAVVLAAMAAGQAAGLVASLVGLRIRLRVGAIDSAILAEALRYGIPLIISGTLSWTAANGIRVLVEAREGLVGVGLFSAGWGLGQRLAVVLAMLCTAAAFPLAVERLESGDRRGALRQVAVNGALMLGLLAPALAGVVVLSKPLVLLLIAPQYQEVTILTLPLAMATSAARMMRTHLGDQTGLLLERTGWMTVFNFLDAFLSLVGGAIGVYKAGVIGAAVGCLIGAALGSVASIAFTVFGLGLPIRLSVLAKILFATAIMGATLLALPMAGGFVSLAIRILLGIGVYAAATLAFFSEARAPLRKRLQRRFAG